MASDLGMAYQWLAGWQAHEIAQIMRDGPRDIGLLANPPSWPFEVFQTLNGELLTRIRSSVFLWGGFLSLVAGIALISSGSSVGGALAVTVAPCLFLYPPVRFLFGGKGGVLPAITTIVVEEVLKRRVFNALDGREKGRKRR
ncbi:hypothetical protein [Hydrogenophaga sp.]|uniref:hypothetical protein n=1 Tax=Hydrogenophaga sp. TaxID=1904254 RepID=UPI003D119A7A